MLTGESYVRDVLKEPLLAEEFEWVFGCGFSVSLDTKLKDIGHLGGMDEVKSVHGGLNKLLENKQKGILPLRPIWDAEEIAMDESRKDTALYCFPVAEKRPFALICPGGGYGCVCSVTEGFPLAAALNKMGIPAFMLVYRTGANAKYPAPQDDLAQAVRIILSNTEQFNVTRENYSVWGFSAGGHLAASFGTKNMGAQAYSLPGPGAIILSYPVITMGERAHVGSRNNLLGPNCTKEDIAFASVENHVDRFYPCTYIWTCLGDSSVSFENSRALKEQLSKVGVRHRLKAVQGTTHGLSLANGTPAEGWFSQAVAFWRSTMR